MAETKALEPVAWLATDDDVNPNAALTRKAAVADIWHKAGLTIEPLVSATAAQAEIERLTKQRDELELDLKAIFDQSEIKAAMHMARTAAERRATAETEFATLRARNAELVEGLRPFAEFASLQGFDKLPDDMPMTSGSRMAAKQVTASDFCRARNLTEKPDGKTAD